VGMSGRRKVAFRVHGHARNRVTGKIKPPQIPGGSVDAEATERSAHSWRSAVGIVTTTGADARTVEVVVETPKGSHNKLKYDPKRAAFRLSNVLPIGMTFPFDFGFLPDTAVDDGDPLDVLVFMDAPCPVACLVDVRLVGVLEVEQREKTGEVVRNDRLIGVAETSATHASTHELTDLPAAILTEIEAFFDQYNRLDGKQFQLLHGRGSQAAALVAARAAVHAPVGSR
jgi:inorganic pyrophosphatase